MYWVMNRNQGHQEETRRPTQSAGRLFLDLFFKMIEMTCQRHVSN